MKRSLCAARSEHGPVLLVIDQPWAWWIAAEVAAMTVLRWSLTWSVGNWICTKALDSERHVAEIPAGPEVLRRLVPWVHGWPELTEPLPPTSCRETP